MSRLALFLLGAPRIEVEGAPIEVNRRKAVALVAYLVVTAESHSRDVLATMLWPDYDQTRARAALRRTLSVLNQLLGQWLDIERETLASVVLEGYDSPALGGFVPPGMPGYSPGIGLPFDPERARQLLAEAGYPGGRGFPAVEWLIKPNHQPVAEYLQAQWRTNLGLALQWHIIAWNELLDRLDRVAPDVFQMGWMADYLDPDNFLRVSFHDRWSDWRNERRFTPKFVPI